MQECEQGEHFLTSEVNGKERETEKGRSVTQILPSVTSGPGKKSVTLFSANERGMDGRKSFQTTFELNVQKEKKSFTRFSRELYLNNMLRKNN